MKSCLLTVFFLYSVYAFNAFGQNKFSAEEVREDLQFLRESLEDAHYNLFAYTSEESFDSTYAEVRTAVNSDSLTLLQATNLLQRLVAAVNNGHTSIDFPVQSYIAYAQSGGTVFPLEIAFESGKALVRKNWSDNENIRNGAEILSINGKPVAEILSKIHHQIAAERPYFKNVKIEMYSFPRYYWQVFGQHDGFVVEIRLDGAIIKESVKAVNVIEGYEAKRTEVINPEMKLEFMESSAYLNPGGFGGDIEHYKAFIDSAFAEMNAAKNENLVIDLRNNPGGDDAFADYLVSYIADKPFKWNSRFTLKTSKFLKQHIRKNYDTTEVYWQKALSHKDGEIYDYHFEEYQPQPKEKLFNGEVYVLVNRQSHSQAAVTAAQIQDYGFGTIAGEETGDYPSLYASVFQYSLPNTGIIVNVSKGYIVRVNGSKKEEGVIPDIFIRDHLLDEDDEILDGLLEFIHNQS